VLCWIFNPRCQENSKIITL